MTQNRNTIFVPCFPNERETNNVLKARELPASVKTGRRFNDAFAFLDCFCVDNATGRFVYRVLDLNRYYTRKRNDPCEVPAHHQSGGPKWDMNYRDWIERREKTSIVTVLAGEDIIVSQLTTHFTAYELYISKSVLFGPDLPAPKALRKGAKYEHYQLLSPSAASI